ncbi:hypothetical protein QFC24_004503 [Naganishia onofrii]|uniref:Uncharacterized protein n=1 Tax=Naganishia onofrii TaxID=1851511 RepID=A0ACC2XEV7_9TREE|nr:hypothetical protein QFC24_004503 [Naganishia onofrii]
MSFNIRSNYRTMLTHLLRLPDMEMQSFYRGRYRTLCREVSNACNEMRNSSANRGEETGRAGKDAVRANRYMAQIRREIRRLESISHYLSSQQATSVPSRQGTDTTTSFTSSADRRTREERKFALKAYERMVDATYARTGKRRWEVLEALYPSSLRTPCKPAIKDQQPNQRTQPRIPPSPPAIPAYLKPLEKTVNLTVQAHREKKLKEIYGSEAYKEAIAVRREWKRWSKFMKGVMVPLPDALLQNVQGMAYDPSTGGSLLRLIRYESSYMDDTSFQKPDVPSATSTTPTSAMLTIPRPIRRIHQRMIASVPVLPVLQEVGSPLVARGKGKAAAVTGTKGWVPPPASEDDLRWIPEATSV